MPSIGQSPVSPLVASPGESNGRGDYFSIARRKDPSPSRGEPPTPGSGSGVPPTPGGKDAQTPGGSKLGKLKFGKKKKTSDVPMSTVVESKEIDKEEDTVSCICWE
jgi:hypothetical protein